MIPCLLMRYLVFKVVGLIIINGQVSTGGAVAMIFVEVIEVLGRFINLDGIVSL